MKLRGNCVNNLNRLKNIFIYLIIKQNIKLIDKSDLRFLPCAGNIYNIYGC